MKQGKVQFQEENKPRAQHWQAAQELRAACIHSMTAETSDADPLPLRPEKTAKSMMISLPPYP